MFFLLLLKVQLLTFLKDVFIFVYLNVISLQKFLLEISKRFIQFYFTFLGYSHFKLLSTFNELAEYLKILDH